MSAILHPAGVGSLIVGLQPEVGGGFAVDLAPRYEGAVDEDLDIDGLVISGRELEEKASRSSGPGGQHVNKTSTRVSLRWRPADSALPPDVKDRLLAKLRLTKDGWLVVHVEEARSQLQNRLTARERLAELIREALFEPKKRRKTRPTWGSQQARLTEKKSRSGVKQGRGKIRDD